MAKTNRTPGIKKKVPIPFIDNGNEGMSPSYDPSLLKNLYLIPKDTNSAAPYDMIAVRTPGTSFYLSTPNMEKIRGWYALNTQLYFVASNIVYSVGFSGVFVNIGTLTSFTSKVRMISNGSQIMLVDGIKGYVITIATNAFAAITDPDFVVPAPLQVEYHRGRGIYVTGDQFYISDVNNFTSWQALNFASAEYDPQNLVGAVPVKNDLVLLGENITEIWTLTVDTVFPYVPKAGYIIMYGCQSITSVAEVDGVLVWMAKNKDGKNLLVALDSASMQLIAYESTQNLLSSLDITNCVGKSIQFNGHIFYYLYFPNENRSFLFDIKTKVLTEWHSWEISGYDSNGNAQYVLGRHLADEVIFWNNKSLISDYRSGTILELLPELNVDYNAGVDNSIYYELRTSLLNINQQRYIIDSFTIEMETGTSSVSLEESPTVDNLPIVEVAVSKDRGRTYPVVYETSVGYTGDYFEQVKISKLGQCTNCCFKISGNHSSSVKLYNAVINIRLMDN